MKDYWWLVFAVIIVLFIFNNQSSFLQEPVIEETPSWLEEYNLNLPVSARDYLAETKTFDYSDQEIKDIANNILSNSDSVEEAVQGALDYVYYNINYVWDEPDDICFESTASDIIKRGSGNCDTMSRATITILRAMGIAARPEGGCLSIDYSCYQIFSVLGDKAPKIQEIKIKDGVASRSGGLHEWSQAYIPELGGWTLLESTNGQIVKEDSCLNYVHELFPRNTFQECVSTDLDFIEMCRTL